MKPRSLASLDFSLVSKAVSGDAAALDTILMALERPFYNLALRMLQNHADAEDATQECLIRVATRLSAFGGKSSFSTWAWSVATRRLLDFKRGQARQAWLTAEGFGADLLEGFDPQLPRQAELEQDLAMVKLGCGRAMLQVLDGAHRVAYVLCEILDLPQAEAAQALGISHAALRQRLSRGRSKIQTVLRKNCSVYDPGNPCSCTGRLHQAQQLGRLQEQDANGPDLRTLQQQIDAFHGLSREAAFFRSDPDCNASERMLPRVREVLRQSM